LAYETRGNLPQKLISILPPTFAVGILFCIQPRKVFCSFYSHKILTYRQTKQQKYGNFRVVVFSSATLAAIFVNIGFSFTFYKNIKFPTTLGREKKDVGHFPSLGEKRKDNKKKINTF
jgi:hypothetical protein